MSLIGVNSYLPPAGPVVPAPATPPSNGTTAPGANATTQPAVATTPTGAQPLNTSGPLGTTVNILA